MTGDSQLDRVNSINIDQIRAERMGSAGSGMVDSRGGRAVAGNGGAAQLGPQAQPGQSGPNAANGPPMPGDEPKKETPVYKKWWFWAVVAVSGYVAYELVANSSSMSSQSASKPPALRAAPQPSGLTLLRW